MARNPSVVGRLADRVLARPSPFAPPTLQNRDALQDAFGVLNIAQASLALRIREMREALSRSEQDLVLLALGKLLRAVSDFDLGLVLLVAFEAKMTGKTGELVGKDPLPTVAEITALVEAEVGARQLRGAVLYYRDLIGWEVGRIESVAHGLREQPSPDNSLGVSRDLPPPPWTT